MFYCLLPILFTCCSRRTNKVITKDFDAFPVEQKLTGTRLFRTTQRNLSHLDIYRDSILLLVNSTSGQTHHFFLYDIKSKSFLPPQLEFGRKAGQAMSFLSYGVEDGYIWSYDINKEKILSVNMDSALSNNHNSIITEVSVPGFYYSAQLLNDSVLVGSGDYDSDQNYKLALLDLSQGKIRKRLVAYSLDTSAQFSRVKKMAYESFLYMRPDKEKCVLACRYTDQIEIIDLKSEKGSKIVRGPEGFEPEMVVMTGGDGKKLSTRGSDTRYAFVGGKTTGKYIYLLYSGNKDGGTHQFYGKYIYVYDWNGRPIKRFETEDYIIDFAVTRDDSKIYTYNPVLGLIYEINMKGI